MMWSVTKAPSPLRRALSSLLIASLLIVSPGLHFYEALGQTVRVAEPVAVPVGPSPVIDLVQVGGVWQVPTAAAGLSVPALSLPGSLSLPGESASAVVAERGSARIFPKAAAPQSGVQARSGAVLDRRSAAALQAVRAYSEAAKPALPTGLFVNALAANEPGTPRSAGPRSLLAALASPLKDLRSIGALFDGVRRSGSAGLEASEAGGRPAPSVRNLKKLSAGRWEIDGVEAAAVGAGSFKDVVALPGRPEAVVKIFVPVTGVDKSLEEKRREQDKVKRLEGLGVAPRLLTQGAALVDAKPIGYIVQERVQGFTLETMTPSKLQHAARLFETLAAASIRLGDVGKARKNIMIGSTASRPEVRAYLVDADAAEWEHGQDPKELRASYQALLSSWARETAVPAPVLKAPSALQALRALPPGLEYVLIAALVLAGALAGSTGLLFGSLIGGGTYHIARRLGVRALPAAILGAAAGLTVAGGAFFFTGAGAALIGGVFPYSDWAKDFQKWFKEGISPGESFYINSDKEISDQLQGALKQGLESGAVLQLFSNRYIFAAAPDGGNEFERRAAETLAVGAHAFNEGEPVKALQNAAFAADLLEKLPESMRSKAYADYSALAKVVLANVAARSLTIYARSLGEILDKGETTEKTVRERDVVTKSLSYVEGLSFSRNAHTRAPTAEEAAALAELLKLLAARGMAENSVSLDDKRTKIVLMAWGDFIKSFPPPAAEAPSEDDPPAKRYYLDPGTFPNLNQFAENITLKAVEGKLTPLIGREKEIKALTQTLIRWTKANPALIGPEGVGKTAIVEGLAQAIVDGRVPELRDKIILRLDLGAIVAGTKYRGEFEERAKGIIAEAAKLKGRAILFSDEMHILLGLGAAEGSADMANLIKPALARGDISMIGATTFDEYRKVEKDKALKRRFKPVTVLPSSAEESLAILQGLLPKMKAHHKVAIDEAAVKAAVELSDKYLTDRHLPDKAIDVLDEAASRARLAKAAGVTAEDAAQVVSEWTGIPVAKMTEKESERILALPARLKAKVVRQDQAIDEIASAIVQSRAGIGEENKTLGAFLLAGPTGVGKTHIARSLAVELFGSEKHMIRIDGSEYSEKHTVSRLIGSPPGYVGHDDSPGQLTEAVRRNPYSLILFDEIEEAHPTVQKILLQIMEDGFLTDTHGNRVDFRNTLLIMTTNLGGQLAGSQRVKMGFGGGPVSASAKEGVVEMIKAAFEPKFYNRISSILVLNSLQKEDVAVILDKELGYLNDRLGKKALSLELTPEARKLVLDAGFDAALGARPLKRAMKDLLEKPLALKIVAGELKAGGKVRGDVVDGKIEFRLLPPSGAGPSATGPPSSGSGPALNLGLLGFTGANVMAHFGSASAATPYYPLLFASLGLLLVTMAWTMRHELLRLVYKRYQTPQGFVPALVPPKEERAPLGSWLPKIGLWAAGLVALDWTAKFIASRTLPTFVFHEVAGRLPILYIGVPVAAALILYARWSLGYVDQLAEKHPSLKPALAFYDITVAMALAGVLGNGLEAILMGRVADFIAIGRSTANIADLFLFFAMSHRVIATDFFKAARASEKNNEPITLPFWKYYGLPFLALGASFLSFTAEGGMPLWGLYAFVYGLMVGAGVLVSSIIVTRQARAFNRGFHQAAHPAADLERLDPTFGWGWRLKLKVLSLLAGLGLGVSAPALSGDQAKALLERLKTAPPKLIIMDYDDTFEGNETGSGTEASPAKVALLHDLQKRAHVRVAFATNRPWDMLTPSGKKIGVLQLLGENMPVSDRKNFIIGAGGGAAVYQFSRKGIKPSKPAIEEPRFSLNQQKELNELLTPLLEELGMEPGDDKDVRVQVREHEVVLVVEKQRTKSEALGKAVRKALKKAKLPYTVQLKWPNNPKDGPYIKIANVDKSNAVRAILKLLEEQGEYISPSDVLILADDFHVPGVDSPMARALPGATLISVGKKVDPRLPVYLWPGSEYGPEKTGRILRELADHLSNRRPEHRFSPTQLDLYLRDPKEFKSRYGEPAGQGGGEFRVPLPAFMGRRVHEIMDWLYWKTEGLDLSSQGDRRRVPTEKEAVALFDALWEQHWDDEQVDVDADPYDGPLPNTKPASAKAEAKERKERIQAYKDHGREFVRQYFSRFQPFDQSKTFIRERPLIFTVKGPVRSYQFMGIPDRVALAKDGALEIHDYKSGNTPTFEAAKANLQLPLYAMAVRQSFPSLRGRKVRLIYHYTLTDHVIEMSERDLEEAELRAASISEEIYRKYYASADGSAATEAEPAPEAAPAVDQDQPAGPLNGPDKISRLVIPSPEAGQILEA